MGLARDVLMVRPMSSRLACVAATAAVMLATAGRGEAQPGAAPAQQPAPTPAAAPMSDAKSPGTALALSLGGTIASYTLLALSDDDSDGGDDNTLMGTAGALGIWLAPSLGHWYAGETWTRGLSWRLGGTAAMFTGVIWALTCYGDDGEDDSDDDDCIGAWVLLAGGAGAFVGGTVHDISTAPAAARRANERRRAELQFTVAPTLGHNRAGFAVGGRF